MTALILIYHVCETHRPESYFRQQKYINTNFFLFFFLFFFYCFITNTLIVFMLSSTLLVYLKVFSLFFLAFILFKSSIIF